MVASTLAERFRSHQAETEADRLTQWRQFALDFVNTDPSEADIPETLDRLAELGRTFDELRELTELVNRRKALTGPAADIATSAKEASAAEAAVVSELERFKAVQAEHRRKLLELSSAAGDATAKHREAKASKRELLQTCKQETRDSLADVANWLMPLVTQATQCKETIRENENRRDEQRNLKPDAADLIDRAQQALSDIEPQLQELRERQAELEREAMDPLSIDIN